MMDSQYLNEFLDGIPNERLKKQWSDASQSRSTRRLLRGGQRIASVRLTIRAGRRCERCELGAFSSTESVLFV